ncbi:MAG: NAD(P)H-binding protein [Chloroflexi bacterium]|nr:NAD(P)H-binding protein [Chloroflexota bacterium]
MSLKNRVLVTGGGTLLGDSIANALLAEGADVVLLVRPGTEDRLGALDSRVRWFAADVWDTASLKGRARGCSTTIHTVGSLVAYPQQGLTYQWLNFISARNVANMCVSSGVPHMVLLSSVRAPWINGHYVAAKREAEQYLQRVGLRSTIIRAPLTYPRGARRQPFFVLMSLLGRLPIISWLGFRRVAPLPLDVLARGVARLALEPRTAPALFYAGDLRRKNSRRELRYGWAAEYGDEDDLEDTRPRPTVRTEDERPFGWTPGSDR